MRPTAVRPLIRIVVLTIGLIVSVVIGVTPAAAAPETALVNTSELPPAQRLAEMSESLEVVLPHL